MDVWAVILAAGSATRFGGPKQFATLGGVRVVDRVVETAASACDAVVVVLPSGTDWNGPVVSAAIEGGPSRAESVRRGLEAIPEDAEIIVVHDAAHPLATEALFKSVIEAVRAGVDAAVPAVRLTEPIKEVDGGRVRKTISRDGLMMVQTPHAFRANALRAAHAGAPESVEDSVLVEQAGGAIAVVPGEPRNIHITTLDELHLAEALLTPT